MNNYIPKKFILQDVYTEFCWHQLKEKKIGVSEVAMYLYIIQLLKKVKWNKSDYRFEVGFPLFHMTILGIKSEKTWYKILNKLEASGTIRIVKGSKAKAGTISLSSAGYREYSLQKSKNRFK